MNPASGDVGGDQRGCAAVGEGCEVAGASPLREVAVQLDSRHTGRGQLTSKELGAVLCAGEHQRPARSGGQVHQDRETRLRTDVKNVVLHGGHRRCHGVDAVGDRVAHEALHQHVDRGVQRCREQHALTRLGGRVEQPSYDGKETEVGHVVSLVDHGDLDAVEPDVSALQVVGESARACHDDVDAAAQGVDLGLGADATENGQRAQTHGPSQRPHGGVDL